jgi:hypothetical protein
MGRQMVSDHSMFLSIDVQMTQVILNVSFVVYRKRLQHMWNITTCDPIYPCGVRGLNLLVHGGST